jgi:hypothetical protein
VHSAVSEPRNVDTIFHARVGLVWILQKCTRTRYVDLVFLYVFGSADHVANHVVHLGASEP